MDVMIKKYFWVVPAFTVVVCAILAAKAVNYHVASKFLADSSKPAKVPADIKKVKPKTSSKKKTEEGFVKRNMFCAECEPVVAVADEGVASTGGIQTTSLPLLLVATNVSTIPEESFATIRNTSTERQGAYGLHSDIPEAGEVVEIRGRYVDFKNKATRRVERIAFNNKVASAPKKTAPTTKTDKGGKKNARAELMEMVEEGVNKVNDTTWEIDRSLVEKVTENPAMVARGARVVPSIKQGKTVGIKLYAIRPSSVYAKIGLMNGDTIHSINNFELNSLQKGLEIYTKVREANNLSVSVTRRGKPLTLTYRIK
jgi:general secretion pathway protein C